jgi:hypothetical protein
MSTRKLRGDKGSPVRKSENLTAIYEPIVYKMWKPRRPTTPWASTASYSGSFIVFLVYYQLNKNRTMADVQKHNNCMQLILLTNIYYEISNFRLWSIPSVYKGLFPRGKSDRAWIFHRAASDTVVKNACCYIWTESRQIRHFRWEKLGILRTLSQVTTRYIYTMRQEPSLVS